VTDFKSAIDSRLSQFEAGERRYSLPAIAQPYVFDPLANWEKRADLLRFGVELLGKPGPESRVIVDAAAAAGPGRVRIELFGGAEQLVVIDGGHRLACYVRLEGKRQTFVAGKGGFEPFHAHTIIQRGRDTAVVIGAEVTSNGSTVLVDGDNTAITIGDDCMFAHGIELVATDSHSIFDAATLKHLNPPESISIGRHVWIGSQVSVLKGVRIGDGSIVGTKSLVTRDVPTMKLFAGCPAREIRSGVTWSRHLVPSEAAKRVVLRDILQT
jgi:acetyltransferase-like isoleucine patch superfamily enzyme